MSSLLIDERNKLIGENLRKYRLLKGLTQDELAEGICSVSQLSKVENGKTYLKRDLLKQMAQRLGVSIERVESEDAIFEELSELLQIATDASKAEKHPIALKYAQQVKKQSLEFGYTSMLVEAVIIESTALMDAEHYQEAILTIRDVLDHHALERLQRIDLALRIAYSYEVIGDRLSAHYYYTLSDDEILKVDVHEAKGTRLRVYFGLARCHFFLRNNRTAYRYFDMAEGIATQLTIHQWRIRCSYMKATMLKRMGEWERAEELFLSTLKEAEENSLLFDLGFLHNNLGHLFMERGEYSQAKVHFDRSTQILKLLNEEQYLCDPIIHNAELCLIHGQLEQAERLVQEVLQIVERHPVTTTAAKAKSYLVLGWIEAQRGEFEEYVSHLQRSMDLYAQYQMPAEAYETAKELAEAFYQKGDSRAVDMYRLAMDYNQAFAEFGKRR